MVASKPRIWHQERSWRQMPDSSDSKGDSCQGPSHICSRDWCEMQALSNRRQRLVKLLRLEAKLMAADLREADPCARLHTCSADQNSTHLMVRTDSILCGWIISPRRHLIGPLPICRAPGQSPQLKAGLGWPALMLFACIGAGPEEFCVKIK